MAKVTQILRTASVETTVRRRVCHHNKKKHSIPAGTQCLVIKDTASGSRRNYCPQCADEIFARVDVDLAALRAELAA
jgi:hypothetical protein